MPSKKILPLGVATKLGGAANTQVPYEVIVVDNCSPDGSGLLVLGGTHGVRYVGNARNVGFGPAMNQAVALARAPSVCLLNPDTEVQPAWAPPLLARLNRPHAAAVTPLLLERDGTTPQEAGGVIDGRGWSHAAGTPAWGDDASSAVARVVDYASAACLVVRRDAFDAVGGFDDRYRLAYFEDADLAFALAATGRRMWFEPASRVVHQRGGTDHHGAAIALATENHERFVAKWGAQLGARPPDITDERSRLVLRDGRAPARIVVLDSGDAGGTHATVAAWRETCPDAVLDVVTVVLPEAARRPVAWPDDTHAEATWWRVADLSAWLAVRRGHTDVLVTDGQDAATASAVEALAGDVTVVPSGAGADVRARTLSGRPGRPGARVPSA